MEPILEAEKPHLTLPLKIRKKPGRKPNPASPALRKAQNRAAQRAFRERKENYIKELESANSKLQEQKGKLCTENHELKVEVEVMRSENWYLKGIVLTLHLMCYQHNLVIPQHGPFFSDEVLSVLAQSIPESISTYMDLNGVNKLPKPEKVFSLKNHIKPGNSILSSSFSLAITKDGIKPLPDTVGFKPDVGSTIQTENTGTLENACNVSPSGNDSVYPLELESPSPPPCSDLDNSNSDNINNRLPRPVMLTNEPIATNLAAIQALRLQLRLQNIRARTDTHAFVIRPTLLQLTVPHDPRIDLLPTPHMRDRMILFRDRFDLDDCFRCLLEKSKFHGGDPAIAANWELPPEFFEKYWFLTIDYDLRRTTNKWRTLQGLSKLNFKDQNSVSPEPKMDDGSENQQPALEPSDVNLNDISSLFDFDITKFAQQNNTQTALNPLYNQQELESPSRTMTSEINMNTIEPVLLTDGTKIPGAFRPTMKTAESIKPRRYHPYLNNNKSTSNTHEPQEPWDFVNSQKDCDMLIDRLINAEQASGFT